MNDYTDKVNQQLKELRKKAEAHLDSTEPAIMPDRIQVPVDLIHELRVHQIELEMQNEELRRTQDALEKSRAHYLELYDFAPVGYLSLNEEGIIVEINLTASKLLGKDRKGIINQRFAKFIADDYKDLWYRHFQRAKQYCEQQGCELPFQQKNGTARYLHLNSLCKKTDNASKLMNITLTDVTERKKAEEELRIVATAFETQEGIIVTDPHKAILRMNQAFTRITGYNAEDAIGHTPSFLRSCQHDEKFYQAMWDAVSRNGYWHGEIWDKRKNGELFPVLLTLSKITDSEGNVSHYVGNFTDITVQKQAEKILLDAHNSLENQVASTQEELESIKAQSAEINTALSVLLKYRELDKSDAQLALSDEVESTLLPMLKKLKTASVGRLQSIRLINILETNLQQLVKSYGRTGNISAIYQKLTPIETQVASMIRQGQPTKVIAAALNIAPGTVSIHRKHIRKKLGLDGKGDNLYSYLQSLTD